MGSRSSVLSLIYELILQCSAIYVLWASKMIRRLLILIVLSYYSFMGLIKENADSDFLLMASA